MKINEIIIKEEELTPQAVQAFAQSQYQAGQQREAVLTLQVAMDPKYNNSIDTIQGEVARRIAAQGSAGVKDNYEDDFKNAKKDYKEYVRAFGGTGTPSTPDKKVPLSGEPRQRGAQIGNQNAYKGGRGIDTSTIGSAVSSGYALGRNISNTAFRYSPRSK